MPVIDNVNKAYRMITMQIATGAVVFGLLPEAEQLSILALLHIPQSYVPAVLGIAFMWGRLVKQPGVSTTSESPPVGAP